MLNVNLNINIHGIPFSFNLFSSLVSELISNELAPYLSEEIQEDSFQVTVLPIDGPHNKRIESLPKTLRWVRSRPFWGHYDKEELFLTDGRSLSITKYKESCAEFWIHEATLQDEAFFKRTFLLLPILEILRTRGFFYLHAACVTKDFKTILILGAGGAGKSTLAATLMKFGWQLVADDNLLLRLDEEGRCLAYPFEQELSLSPIVASALGLRFPEEGLEAKLKIAKKFLPQNNQCTSAIPTNLLYLSNDGHSTSASELFHHFVQENPLLLLNPSVVENHLATLNVLLRQVEKKAFQIDHITPFQPEAFYERFSNSILTR